MAGQFVSVDPVNLRKLADKLQALADTVRAEGMPAAGAMDKWGSQSASGLAGILAQLQDVATAMAGRADRARDLLTQQEFGPPRVFGGFDPLGPGLFGPNPFQPGSGGSMLQLPWDQQSADIAYAAKDQQAALDYALNNPSDPDSRATIDRISQDLADNQGDPGYLQVFMKAGGLADSTRVARVLHQQDGTQGTTILSPDSYAIINRYGVAVATATNAAKADPHYDIGDYTRILSNPPGMDMWSTTQLFLGAAITGQSWDPALLDAVTTSELKWRGTVGQRPGVDYPSMTDGPDMPATYSNPGNAWYNSLGLAPRGSADSSSNQALVDEIRGQDPTLGMLDLVSQSGDASRGLLADQDNADALVSAQWAANPDGSSDAYFPASIISAATADRGAANGQASALAALNVMNASAALYGNDKAAGGSVSAPPEISGALTTVALGYLDDMARSSVFSPATPEDKAAISPGVVLDPLNGGWRVVMNQSQINGLLAEAYGDPSNIAIINAAIGTSTYASVNAGLQGGALPAVRSDQWAQLRAISFMTEHATPYRVAESQDAANATENATDQAYLNAISGALGNAPGGNVIGVSQAFLGFITPFIAAKLPTQPTDGAQKVNDATQAERQAAWQELDVPTLQALLDNKKIVDDKGNAITPPAGAPWFQNGKIVPSKIDSSYDAWVTDPTVYAALAPYDSQYAQEFQRITGVANPTDNPLGAPPSK